MPEPSAWVRVATYTAVYQAEMAQGLLEGAGIPSRISSESAGIFGAGWSGPVGKGVELYVLREHEEEARSVLTEI